MTASGWNVYKSAKRFLCSGDLDLDTNQFYMALYTSASNAATELSTIGSISNEVSGGTGYSAKPLANVTWTAGDSAGSMQFRSDGITWRASGGAIANIRFAVVWQAGGKLLCRAELSAKAFDIAAGATLTTGPAPGQAYFELG